MRLKDKKSKYKSEKSRFRKVTNIIEYIIIFIVIFFQSCTFISYRLAFHYSFFSINLRRKKKIILIEFCFWKLYSKIIAWPGSFYGCNFISVGIYNWKLCTYCISIMTCAVTKYSNAQKFLLRQLGNFITGFPDRNKGITEKQNPDKKDCYKKRGKKVCQYSYGIILLFHKFFSPLIALRTALL